MNNRAMNHKNEMNSQSECDRQQELVAYLYNDATATEIASFEKHLKECDPCSAELNAFGRVRDELSTWQVGFAPRTEFVLPRGKMEVLRELLGLFPIRARSLAMAGAAAAAILLALSVIGMLLAAGGFLTPVAGAIGQEIIDILAVLNALRAAFPPKDLTDFSH